MSESSAGSVTPLTVRWGRHGEAREGRRGERGVVGVGARCGGEKATLSEGVIRVRAEGGEHRERFVQNAEKDGPATMRRSCDVGLKDRGVV